MQFFKFKDYVRSWSVWVLGAIATLPMINEQTGIIDAIVPDQHKPLAVSILGAIGLVARAIKQK